MTAKELCSVVRRGEDSRHQFKLNVSNPDALASEVVAFLNSKGGTIFVGVSDVGELVGLAAGDVRRINQLVSNVASQSVRDPVSLITENVAVGKSKTVVAIHVEEGNDKPYFDGKGVVPRGSTGSVGAGEEVQVAAAEMLSRESGDDSQKGSLKGSLKSSLKGSLKSSLKILEILATDSHCTYDALAEKLGISRRAVTKQISNLRKEGKLRRIGPDKGGHWEVVVSD